MTGSYWKQCLSDVIAEATKQLEYAELMSNQAFVVKHFLEEKDIFVSLPTAFGNTPVPSTLQSMNMP